MFGAAVLASVFARPGVYASPAIFVDGFKAALWVGAGFSAAGVVASLVGVIRRPLRIEGLSAAPARRAFADAVD